ncbi:MAG: hypothetical protein C0434_09740 [Xanthomonadaceae bacterium]|nr:hypothetical protein [Xanthomonadaceae bacterium]
MATETKRELRPRRTARASVSFPQDLYATLEQIAKGKKVSVAWVIRDAAKKYVGDQWPLLASQNSNDD